MDQVLQNTEDRHQAHPAQALDIHTYRYGDEIIREGDCLNRFYVILSGQVRVSQMGKKIRLLDDQDIFGLEAMACKKPSPYTARALSKSRIAAYGPEALDHFIRENPRMTQSILYSTLQQLMQTTQNLSHEAELFAIEDVRVNFYSDGDVIIEEGSRGTDFFRLVSTERWLTVTVKGKEVGRVERPGEFFGEMAGLLDLPRQATITSVGNRVVESYSIEDLDVIIRDYPDIALQMMRTLVARIVDMNRKITGLNK
jgi:CRP-like cAMP-binding protein